jgi:hypothetical protein
MTAQRREAFEAVGEEPGCAEHLESEDAARELPNLPRQEFLQLVHLYAERGSPKYERTGRCVARVSRPRSADKFVKTPPPGAGPTRRVASEGWGYRRTPPFRARAREERLAFAPTRPSSRAHRRPETAYAGCTGCSPCRD